MAPAARVMPVLVACQGCPEFGQVARDAAARLDERRQGESHWLGAAPARLAQLVTTVRSRYPVYAVEGCDKRCAETWLAGQGVRPQRRIIVRP